MSGLEDIIW